jgi:hypothetical protein
MVSTSLTIAVSKGKDSVFEDELGSRYHTLFPLT